MVSISLSASGKFDKSGGTLTGPLILERDPLGDLEAATRRWVLTQIGSGGGGGVQIGGDLGGTNSAPTVILTHLGSPLPLAQGGTNAADAPGARTQLGLGTAATANTGAFDSAGAAATALAAAVQKSLATTKGDLLAATGAGAIARLGAGADGQLLSAASGQSAGLQWVPAPTVPGAASSVVAETGYGQTQAVGTDTTYAREDHTHGSPSLTSAAPATTLGIGQAAAAGTATTPARADHVHPLAASATPAASAVADSAVAGSATTFAASDHRHGRESFGAVAALSAFNTASVTGTAASVSHSDHVHGAPALPVAGTSTAGVVQLDGTAGDIAALGAQAAGAIGKAADAGHVHPATGLVLASQLPLSIANGGTGQATQQAAINALAGAVTAGRFLRGDGTNATLAAIQAADVPVLNQDTTGTAAGLSSTLAIGSGGTGAATATAALVNLGAVASDWCDMLGVALLTADPRHSGVTYQQTPGDLVLCLCTPSKTRTISNLAVWVTAAGVTGSGVNALALFTEAGVLIDQTGDMTTAWSSTGMVEGAMGGSHTVTAGTNYYLGFLTHFSGTSPHLAATGTAGTANFPVTNGRYTAIFKSGQASIPSSFTPSAYTPNSGYFIMYGR